MSELNVATIVVGVSKQDEAVAWYTEKLGFELREDHVVGELRWRTVGAPGDPVSFSLADWFPDNIGTNTPVELRTADCVAEHARLSANGVEFVEEPTQRSYGLVAIFKDLYGNIYLLKQS